MLLGSLPAAPTSVAPSASFILLANRIVMFPRTGKDNPRRCTRAAGVGFTLLELAVVMFVMGLIMMIAVPYLGGLKGSELRSEVRRLASRANYLCEEAGAQKVLIRLSFDLNHDRYFATRLDPFAAKPVFSPERGPAGDIVYLPPGVHLRDVWVEGAGTMTRGVAVTQFYPGGYVDATVIHLVDDRGEVFTLGIEPESGHVAISKGDVRSTAALGTTG